MMVKAMAGTLPWAVVLAVAWGAAWWLLTREMAAGRWLLAALLIGHGAVHLLFSVPAPAATDGGAAWPFDMARSWLVAGAGLDASTVRVIGMALIAVVGGGFSLAALSAAGIIVPAGWWQPTVALSAATSAVMLVLFFDPQLVLGLAMDAVLLWVAVAKAWVP
jgi:hypothetical protein